jgi:glycosyltransferase involved in cell wall biosynthesis
LNKPIILIVYEYFYPAYKAGGPIQSLMNLIKVLKNDYDFYVLTSAYDFGVQQPHTTIKINEWNTVTLSNKDTYSVEVWYSNSLHLDKFTLLQIYNAVQPNFIYINGLYTSWCNTILRSQIHIKSTIILCPRGMLQQGALAVKPFKKKLYLLVFKLFGYFNNIVWHATNEEEKRDILNNIHKRAIIKVAGNIPKIPLQEISKDYAKKANQLNLVYLSLITPKKQLHILLQTLLQCKSCITLDIYGPIKDEEYWLKCKLLIEKMPVNCTVNYCNDVQPNAVQQTLQQYDAKILLTKGENFGHALYESLSVGTPIITSYFTAWNNLQSIQAGWNVDITNTTAIASLLDTLAGYSAEQWAIYQSSALALAKTYYSNGNFTKFYKQLLSNNA